jgi:hypothetical protein
MRKQILVALFSLVLLPSLSADVVNYGNFVGANVNFIGVSESSSSIGNGAGQVSALFGAPTVMANMLIFNPTQFEANQQGTGIDLTDGQLSMTIVGQAGFQITGVIVDEFGDYTIATPFAGGAGFVNASANAFATTNAGTFTGGFAFSVNNNVPPGVFNIPWIGGMSFGPSGSVTFTMDNTLVAAAQTATDASFIKKKGVKITVVTSVIPEPASAVFGLALLAGCLVYRKR